MLILDGTGFFRDFVFFFLDLSVWTFFWKLALSLFPELRIGVLFVISSECLCLFLFVTSCRYKVSRFSHALCFCLDNKIVNVRYQIKLFLESD